MVEQQYLLEPIPCDKFDLMTKEELVILLKGEQKIRLHFQRENEELKRGKDEADQKAFYLEEQFVTIRNKFFGKSSERSPKTGTEKKDKKPPRKKVQLPSLRYPNAPLIETDVELQELPLCPCCGEKMADSGMTEDSEYLTVIPRKFYVVRQKRHKYRCGSCHGDIKTAPALPKIKTGSSYSDEMVIDVAMSKYCDLIPIERYTAMAERSGIMGLPPHSLIQTTHGLADFIKGAYDKLKLEITSAKVLHADETPHRMLEGDKKSNWYLWGFSTDKASYFEAHDTRSGDVASSIFKNSKCEFLISDVFSGYNKAVKESNISRRENTLPLIRNVYCNAHARRKFKEAEENFKDEAKYFIKCYRKIYQLNQGPPEVGLPLEKRRQWQEIYFKLMKRRALPLKNYYPKKSAIAKALKYFLKNYDEFTLFLKFEELPIDNNSQERLMRNPVIGRKTWYGTHSKRGAQTNTILFSLVESCKLNNLNPRKYFAELVEVIHQGRPPFTPGEVVEITL